MWELDHKEGLVPKNWCFLIVVLEKTFENPLDSKYIKAVNRKEINPECLFVGWMRKLKLQCFLHIVWRAESLEESLMLEKIVRAEEKGATEDEMVG